MGVDIADAKGKGRAKEPEPTVLRTTTTRVKRPLDADQEEPTITKKRKFANLTDADLEGLTADEFDQAFSFVKGWEDGLPHKVNWLNRQKDNMIYWTRYAIYWFSSQAVFLYI